MDTTPPTSPPTGSKTSPGAIWSLVLGILSMFCLWILGSIPAIILGTIAIKKINREPEKFSGKGIALAGIITGSVGILSGLLTLGVVSAIAIPSLTRTNEIKTLMEDQVEIGVLVNACRLYAADHDDDFPPTLEHRFPDYISNRDVLTAEISTNPTVVRPHSYRAGLTDTSPLHEIVIAGPARGSTGKRAIGRVDGATDRTAEPLHPEFGNDAHRSDSTQ